MPLRVVSREGYLLGEFGEERRSLVKIENVPEVMKHAIIAAEDERFYEHGGVDFLSLLRAALAKVTSNSRQGGGTITMQVARNFFLTREYSYVRKIREALLAWKIEAHLSKDKILELYINQIFLGQRSYGFAAAARTYFNKRLDQLTPAEAAMLAGLPKAPSAFNPLVNPKRAKLRQLYVLSRMHALNFLTDAEYEAAKTQKLVYRPQQHQKQIASMGAEFVAEMARRKVVAAYGEDAYTMGLTVWTTISAADQKAAYQAVRTGVMTYDHRHGYRGPESAVTLPPDFSPSNTDEVERLFANYSDYDGLPAAIVLSAAPNKVEAVTSNGTVLTIADSGLDFARRALSTRAPKDFRIRRGSVIRVAFDAKTKQYEISQLPEAEASLVSIDPKTGALLALVGGFDFARNQFNHATQAFRQTGSSFKPFIYSAALEKGFSPATIVNDGPFCIPPDASNNNQGWCPKNFEGTYDGPMRLRVALAKSKNLVTIRLLQAITPQYAQDYITRFGFAASQQPPYLSMALGAGLATPMQMASAYGVFADKGSRIAPYFIDLITDARGNVIQSHANDTDPSAQPQQVIDPRNAFIMTTMLRSVIQEGTGQRAKSLGRGDLAGKTGTTNDSQDAWFCGFNADVVAVAWIGFDQPRTLGRHETGASAALPIWMLYMRTALDGDPETPLTVPQGVVSVPIDVNTGLRLDTSDFHEWFYSEFLPPPESQNVAPDASTFDQIF